MFRSFKYRLWTNANQERELAMMLETHRRLYNACLEERKSQYDLDKTYITYYQQCAKWTVDRKTNPYYARLAYGSAQTTIRRLDKAFSAFFRRIKKGNQKPGYPRFKSRDAFNSIDYPRHGEGVRLKGNRLKVLHVGHIRVNLHRQFSGEIKRVSLKREAGKWFVFLCCDLGDVVVQASQNPPVGIDVGLTSFLATSDGEIEPNPKYLKSELRNLQRLQRKVCRKKLGGRNRTKAKKLVVKRHAKIRNQRNDHRHKTALRLVRRYGFIAVESLDVQGMLKNHRLARAISDAGWSGFLQTLKHKAESAGVSVVEVDPRGTSQECSACGHVVQKDLSQRWHSCECGCSLDRDENAARNILARGLRARTEPAGVNVAGCRKRPPRSRRRKASE